jgi:L-cysteine S-thiosulfotransferase
VIGMKKFLLIPLLAGCASLPSPQELDAMAAAAVRASFSERGIAKLDRVAQDDAQTACSSPTPPDKATSERIEKQARATLVKPADGQYLGNWQAGERLAQNGRGLTWTDSDPKANGGNCYNCHQIDKKEISFGTIGPSLWNYGKLRGVSDPAHPDSKAMLEYTWGKLWNSQAYTACSNMPRFGHKGILSEAQIKDLMALLLDPKSPVNQ